MESKENKMLKIFFEEPAKEWHFEEIVNESGMARSKAYGWLKRFTKEKIIKRTKARGRMPHYIAAIDSPNYRNRKKLFAMEELYESGFLNHLTSLEKAKTAILFGSFSRWDWRKGSDIDLFIYGDASGLDIAKYQSKLHHDIQLFECEDARALAKMRLGMMRNIIKGNLIKGDLDFIEVKPHAKISNS